MTKQKIKDISDKIAEKKKQINGSKNLFERYLLREELRDLEEILSELLDLEEGL